MIFLRPYQTRILNAVRVKLHEGKKSIVCVAPTGSGKTAMFAEMARSAASKTNRVLILVHRQEIFKQTLKSLFRLGVVSGQIASGRAATQDTIQTAMVGTLIHRLADIRRPDYIIVDEGHHAVSPTWKRILNYWGDVPRTIWTATPEREDGRGLCEVADAMVIGPQVSELVADGWLCPPILYRAPDELSFNYHMTRGDFDKKEQQEKMSGRRIVGDVIDHYRETLDHLPSVCFCVNIEHCRLMAKQFCDAGYKARVVWGDMPDDERASAILGLSDGSVDVVCSCDLISEGVDVPVMVGAIMLRRTASLALYLQQGGRALRPVFGAGFDANAATATERLDEMARSGKPNAVILDHAGNYQLHGHILAPREWTLDAAPRSKRAERPPVTTTCPRCYGVWPGTPRVCPGMLADGETPCEYEFTRHAEGGGADIEIKVVAGKLVEAGLEGAEADQVASVYARAMRATGKDRQKMLLGAAFRASDKRVVDELAKLAGYHPGWSQIAWDIRNRKLQGGRG